MVENVESIKKNQETSMGQTWESHRTDLKNSVGTLACGTLTFERMARQMVGGGGGGQR